MVRSLQERLENPPPSTIGSCDQCGKSLEGELSHEVHMTPDGQRICEACSAGIMAEIEAAGNGVVCGWLRRPR